MAPPVPIPNTEVKRLSADDTGGATLWENMPLPEAFSKPLEVRYSLCITQNPKISRSFDTLNQKPYNLIGGVG